MFIKRIYSQILINFLLFGLSFATTEWFGDLRASLYPPEKPPYHDIIYDDSECHLGIQSNAVPEFVYFGAMINSKSLRDHTQCIRLCLTTPKCVAVNFFESLKSKEKGFCELLSESQFDNPRLMRSFKSATYYDNIQCRTKEIINKDNFEHVDVIEVVNKEDVVGSRISFLKDKNQHVRVLTPTAPTPTERQRITTKPIITTTTAKRLTNNEILKKLAAKVHEFNVRFAARQ